MQDNRSCRVSWDTRGGGGVAAMSPDVNKRSLFVETIREKKRFAKTASRYTPKAMLCQQCNEYSS